MRHKMLVYRFWNHAENLAARLYDWVEDRRIDAEVDRFTRDLAA